MGFDFAADRAVRRGKIRCVLEIRNKNCEIGARTLGR